jgi:twinkle protein
MIHVCLLTGKTTMLSQLSIDFAKVGAKTLWGSFEIKNHRLARKMLQQYHSGGGPFLELPREQREKVADDFETLPLLFMNFHSGTELDEVLGCMEFAVYRDDVQHIILDNLQFMMPRESSFKASGGFAKFASQDYAIDKFRNFATEKNVNIILVIHPKKDDDKSSLGISSVFGTAKATQEADAILILQRDEKKTYLDLKKNRYDGDLGKINLGFSPVTSCFFELTS